jgi:small subunit ribosomal protein S6
MGDEIKYELMVIIDPDLGAPAIKKKLETIKKLIAEQKGKIFFEDIWGARDLAYSIKKKDRGYYAVLDFEGEDIDLNEIDHALKLDNEVLRHLIVRLPFGFKAKSLAEIEAEVKKTKAAEKKKEEAKPSKKKAKPVEAPEKAEEVMEEKVEEKAPEEVKEEAKEPEKPEEQEEKKTSTLEEVDEKLKHIIDNPDLNF